MWLYFYAFFFYFIARQYTTFSHRFGFSCSQVCNVYVMWENFVIHFATAETESLKLLPYKLLANNLSAKKSILYSLNILIKEKWSWKL